MNSQQLSHAVADSARRLASRYRIDRYCGPIIGLCRAIATAEPKAPTTPLQRYAANEREPNQPS